MRALLFQTQFLIGIIQEDHVVLFNYIKAFFEPRKDYNKHRITNLGSETGEGVASGLREAVPDGILAGKEK